MLTTTILSLHIVDSLCETVRMTLHVCMFDHSTIAAVVFVSARGGTVTDIRRSISNVRRSPNPTLYPSELISSIYHRIENIRNISIPNHSFRLHYTNDRANSVQTTNVRRVQTVWVHRDQVNKFGYSCVVDGNRQDQCFSEHAGKTRLGLVA